MLFIYCGEIVQVLAMLNLWIGLVDWSCTSIGLGWPKTDGTLTISQISNRAKMMA